MDECIFGLGYVGILANDSFSRDTHPIFGIEFDNSKDKEKHELVEHVVIEDREFATIEHE